MVMKALILLLRRPPMLHPPFSSCSNVRLVPITTADFSLCSDRNGKGRQRRRHRVHGHVSERIMWRRALTVALCSCSR